MEALREFRVPLSGSELDPNKKRNVTRNDCSNDSAVTSITIQVEYTNAEKKTRRITKYADGSQTISTTIEELLDDGDDDDDDIEFLD
jgi:hypothetical protein